MVSDWIILTCSNCKTMDLARSLTDAGYEAWSPVETVSRRSRSGAKPEDVLRPLMPSWVFAKADRMMDLIALSHSPTLNYQVWDAEQRRMVTRGHPFFRLFKINGESRRVPDHQLDHLRKLEHRRRPKGKPRTFARGAAVRFTEGGFAGLNGIVEEVRGDYAIVTVNDWSVPVQIATWLLHPAGVHVNDEGGERSAFAQAA